MLYNRLSRQVYRFFMDTVLPPTKPRTARVAHGYLPTRVKVYLYSLALLLPIDFFRPTAALFREGGARPAIPLMALGTAWILYRHWAEILFQPSKLWRQLLLAFVTLTFLGAFAFLVNVAGGFSIAEAQRTPLQQFVTQAALFVLALAVLLTHAWLFSRPAVTYTFLRTIPSVCVLHVLAIFAEISGVVSQYTYPLALFRGYMTIDGRKSTGLMTEPSYVGVFAATYGMLLLTCLPEKRRRDKVLALFLIVFALLLGGKTLIPALASGLVAYAYQRRVRILNRKTLLVFAAVMLITIYTVTTYSALDVQTNLSSAMRLGSTLLAINVARSGYGLFGVGFGQFHFFYKPEYAPWFLQYTQEAQSIFSGSSGSRASTFNLFVRLLVEEGILGLLVFLWILRRLFRHGRRFNDGAHLSGAVLAGCSLGFLLTQDAYFFPTFVVGAAILASGTSITANEVTRRAAATDSTPGIRTRTAAQPSRPHTPLHSQ